MTGDNRSRRSKSNNTRLALIFLAVVGVLLVAFFLMFPNSEPLETIDFTPRAYSQEDGTALGSKDAKVLVEVWQDFRSPESKGFTQNIEPRLIQDYIETGKARYVFRQFPYMDLTPPSQESHQAANASMCAAEQGRFWEYHDILFADFNTPNEEGFSDHRLLVFAKALNLDLNIFKTCFKDDRYKAEIDRDFSRGVRLHVIRTPAVFVNKQLVVNSQQADLMASYADISKAIDQALTNSGQP